MNVPSRSPYIDYQLLAKHIRKYRKLRSLTQADLAIKLGYKTGTNYGKVCLCSEIKSFAPRVNRK